MKNLEFIAKSLSNILMATNLWVAGCGKELEPKPTQVRQERKTEIDFRDMIPYISDRDGSIIYIPQHMAKELKAGLSGKLPAETVFSSIERHYETIGGYQFLTEEGLRRVKTELSKAQNGVD